jgi:serine/threonine-protein kinase
VALPDGDPTASVVTDGIVGTPLYMSPEALWNQPPEVGFDLWSAAVVLFEALTGRHPFQRDTWPETVDAIVRGRWDESPRMRAAVPDSWAEFFRESLHRDRDRRPADAAAFRRRLETTPRSDSQPS